MHILKQLKENCKVYSAGYAEITESQIDQLISEMDQKNTTSNEDLRRCFNCGLKFHCQDAISGKFDPCSKWTNKPRKNVTPPKEIS